MGRARAVGYAFAYPHRTHARGSLPGACWSVLFSSEACFRYERESEGPLALSEPMV
jgi:hypothetical protein